MWTTGVQGFDTLPYVHQHSNEFHNSPRTMTSQVRPLERMLGTVRKIASTVFKFSAEARDWDGLMGLEDPAYFVPWSPKKKGSINKNTDFHTWAEKGENSWVNRLDG